MSADIDALRAGLAAGVARGELPGAVALVEEAGQLRLAEGIGRLGPGNAPPMPTDALFWIASMTKPVTTLAALMLVEAGRLRLDDRLGDILPPLARLRPAMDPPGRPPTVRDLMTHTAGFLYGPFGDTPLHRAYQAAQVYDFDQTNAELVDRLAPLPLAHRAGTVFEYGMSTDVLGRVVEVASGVSLGEFLHDGLFAPLGMTETGFVAPAGARRRLARPLDTEAFALAPPLEGVRWESGGSGLWSTAPDYLRFARLLMARTEADTHGLVSPTTLQAMRRPALETDVGWGESTAALGSVAPTPARGRGFGLGLSVRVAEVPGAPPGSEGDFTWPGVSGTNFWCEPAHERIVLVMAQAPSVRLVYRDRARAWVHGQVAP